MVSTSPPVLAADLNAGLKRLKMAAMRRLAPGLLVTAKTQRWSPEEFLRTLVEAEIAARDASNAATRRRPAGFPVTKILDDYDLTASSGQQARSRRSTPHPATGVSTAGSPGLGFSGTHRSAKKPVERSGRRGVAARKSSCRATAER